MQQGVIVHNNNTICEDYFNVIVKPKQLAKVVIEVAQQKAKGLKVGIVIISLIIILVAVYGIAVKYSAVQRADKEVTTACAVLKQLTIDVKNAMNDMPDPTLNGWIQQRHTTL